MPKLTIDGKEIEVPPGTNLIEAARRLGIEIPHYCYHPGLSIAGQCRLCMVDIEKAPRPTIACNTQAADGMVVHTQSDRVKETRRSIMEFHLINHPLDCPVCDQAGECWLQIYYMKHGLYDPRMTDEKVHKPKAVPIGPHVMLDAERCILCSRCVRFCDEVTKTGELGIFNRGDHSEIGLFPGTISRTSTPATSSTSARWARSPIATSASRCASGTSTRRSPCVRDAPAAATSTSTSTGGGRTTRRAAASRG